MSANNRIVVGILLAALAALGLASPTAAQQTSDHGVASAQAHARKASCGSGDWHSAVAGYTGWAEDSACAATSNTTAGFTWTIPPGSNGRICVEANGSVYNKTTKKNVHHWYSLGCGTGGSASVPWCKGAPNVCVGPKRVRAKVQPGFLGAAYVWK